jgi:hypothetical protein
MKLEKINLTRSGMIFALLLLVLVQGASASNLVLDSITYDPAIISAGDEVDIIVQFHEEFTPDEPDYKDDPRYQLRVKLEPDDTVTKNHVIMLDEEGDKLAGHTYENQYFNMKYRVKFKNDAPAGNYQFRLVGTYEYEGVVEEVSRSITFRVPVKKEGIILGISNIITEPAEVRPGDDYVKVDAYLENMGEKYAKAISIDLDLPEGIKSAYSNDNHVWIGVLDATESKPATFYLDVGDAIEPGVYDIAYVIKYMDVDNNRYEKRASSRLLIKDRPYLEVESFEGIGASGTTGELKIYVKNTGGTSAESVDVRLLKESSQPFDFDVRSKYLGELDPGEVGEVIFDVKARSEAEEKNHSFKVVLRAKGDSDEGDDNIYLFDREAKYEINGQAPNYLKTAGLILLLIVLVVILAKIFGNRKKRAKFQRKK